MRTIGWIALLGVALMLAGCESKPAGKTDKKTADKTAPAPAKTADVTKPTPPPTEPAPKEIDAPAKGGAEVKTGEPKFPDEPLDEKTPAAQPKEKEKATDAPSTKEKKTGDDPFAKDSPGQDPPKAKASVAGALANALIKGASGGKAKPREKDSGEPDLFKP
jgi:hypothetical protein